MSWFHKPEINRPRLVLLYFSEPDHTGHVHGANRVKIIESVIEMDQLLGYLIAQLEHLDIYSKLNLLVVSDHGMSDVSAERLIILDDYVSQMDGLYINGRGTHVQFDLKRGKSGYRSSILRELNQIPHSRLWEKDKIPERFHLNNNNSGDFLLLADEGWFITTKSGLEEKEFTLGGMHGYDPELPNMQGIFYAMGVNLKNGVQISAFENIHIYPLLCEILDINPYNGATDAPEGDIRILQNILME